MEGMYVRREGSEICLVDALLDELTVNPGLRARYRRNPRGYLDGLNVHSTDPRRGDLIELASWPDRQLQKLLAEREA
jgi:hypothetical protein